VKLSTKNESSSFKLYLNPCTSLSLNLQTFDILLLPYGIIIKIMTSAMFTKNSV